MGAIQHFIETPCAFDAKGRELKIGDYVFRTFIASNRANNYLIKSSHYVVTDIPYAGFAHISPIGRTTGFIAKGEYLEILPSQLLADGVHKDEEV